MKRKGKSLDMGNKEKIILNKKDINKVKYSDIIIVYTNNKIWYCQKDSEKELEHNLVEYTLLKKGGNQNGN
jgi:hypothetical protein